MFSSALQRLHSIYIGDRKMTSMTKWQSTGQKMVAMRSLRDLPQRETRGSTRSVDEEEYGFQEA